MTLIKVFSYLLIGIYAGALAFIFIYSLVQLHLAWKYLRFHFKKRKNVFSEPELKEFPFVTVQLPVYNELYVIERLIDAVSEFEYPADRFEIQVLDDSTDETVKIIEEKVKKISARGINIGHIRRQDRTGFKAGALQHGLAQARGEFIAIFDADFIPNPDFLLRTIPNFDSPEIGVVQTRWGHINKDYSILTRLQAFALDAHFSVEQQGRNAGGYFINFNGTAGVWRKQTIIDAGGWQSDTLTEDLDLSYRAQLKGWKFRFLEDMESPAELPAMMGAIKSQQFRWTKGAAETARKNLGKVLKARIPFGIKLHATFHLLNSFLFICVLVSAFVSLPLLILRESDPQINALFEYASGFILSLFFLIFFFGTSRMNREIGHGPLKYLKFIGIFPVFLSISMGMSLHNAIATMEGYLGIKSPFIRTPKFNIRDLSDNWKDKTLYISKSITPVTWIEGFLMLYFFCGTAMSWYWGDYPTMAYHFLLFTGFGTIFFYSVKHSIRLQ